MFWIRIEPGVGQKLSMNLNSSSKEKQHQPEPFRKFVLALVESGFTWRKAHPHPLVPASGAPNSRVLLETGFWGGVWLQPRTMPDKIPTLVPTKSRLISAVSLPYVFSGEQRICQYQICVTLSRFVLILYTVAS